MMDYSKIIEIYDIKVGIYSKLNECIGIDMYQRSMLSFDLCRMSLGYH